MCELIECCCQFDPSERLTANEVCEVLATLREGFEHRQVQPVDHDCALRQTLSYFDVRTADANTPPPPRGGAIEKRKGRLFSLFAKRK